MVENERRSGNDRRSNWTSATARDIRLIELKAWILVEMNKLREENDSITEGYWEGYEQGFYDVIQKIIEMEKIK